MFFIGIDIGGTNLRAAVISKEGDIVQIFKVENEVQKGAAYNLNKLVNQIKGQWSSIDI